MRGDTGKRYGTAAVHRHGRQTRGRRVRGTQGMSGACGIPRKRRAVFLFIDLTENRRNSCGIGGWWRAVVEGPEAQGGLFRGHWNGRHWEWRNLVQRKFGTNL